MSVKSSGACSKRIETVFDKRILSQINEHREAAERITQNSGHKFYRRSSSKTRFRLSVENHMGCPWFQFREFH